MAFNREASAAWKGDLKNGSGTISTESGALDDTAYDFGSRFDTTGTNTNPEELIGAAHAGCFTMFLSNILAQAGNTPEFVRTKATVTLDTSDGPNITTVKLVTEGKVPGIDAATFQKFAEDAKQGCPVSKALNTLDIQLETKFVE